MDAFTCPRCGLNSVATFYGPCDVCRDALRDGATIRRPGPPAAGAPSGASRPHEAPSSQRSTGGLVSRRRTVRVIRDLGVRPPAVLDWRTGAVHVAGAGHVATIAGRAGLDVVLDAARTIGVGRVLVTGVEAPALLDEWSTSPPPDPWTAGVHYLGGDHPTLTYERDAGRVTLATASQWCGAVDEVEHVAAGLENARQAVEDAFPGRGALLASPASTGRELVARTVTGDGYPVLSDDVQELIRRTTPQHRMETLQPAGMQLPRLVEVDMRLAYGAVCWGLPVGEPTWHVGEPDGWRPQTRGRFLCSWRVPGDWSHVGVLPTRVGEGEPWRWPATPGEPGRGWIDGAELALARQLGWPVEVEECFTWPDGGPDPLRRWADKLTAAAGDVEHRGDVGRAPRQTATAGRNALRAILVHGLGALHGTPRTVTHTIAGGAGEPPAGVPYRIVWETGAIVWQDRRPPAWPEMAHPEWTAAVWARTRCRLLRGPRGRGALALPRVDLIAFRGDALYVAHDPDWTDEGRAGDWRAKGDPLGPFTMPETLVELDALRRRGADPLRGLAAARTALAEGTRA